MVKKKHTEEEPHKSAHKKTIPVENEAEGTMTEASEGNNSQDEEAKKENAEQELTAKLAEMQDKYLRLSAEFDNYRKRTLKEKMDITKTAGESVIISILPVIDDFERAIQSIESTSDIDSVKAGISLIYNKMADFLKQNGVKEIESFNADFDSDIHDAVTKIAAAEESMKGKVVDVIQKGYTLNEKIIRHPKVVVGE